MILVIAYNKTATNTLNRNRNDEHRLGIIRSYTFMGAIQSRLHKGTLDSQSLEFTGRA